MRTKIIFLSLLFFSGLQVAAQKKFIVYHVNGNVNLLSGSNAAAAKRGDVLTKSGSLQVKPGANCMLIGEKGNSVQLSSGTYSFNEVEKRLATAAGTNVTQKFFSYVYESFSSGKGADKLSVTPVVFRGDELMKVPADNTIIISDAFAVGWKKPAGKIPVHLIIQQIDGEKILDTVLKAATSLPISISGHGLKTGRSYQWKTEERDTRQPKVKYFTFLVPEKKDRKKILADLKLLQAKGISNELRSQLQHDIFLKWEQFYSK